MKNINEVLDCLWRDYVTLNPKNREIHALLMRFGGRVTNDHIAFRTFDLSPVKIADLALHFTRLGYTHAGDYDIREKNAVAIHLDPPAAGLPKVFISHLCTEAFSDELRRIVSDLVAAVSPARAQEQDFLWSGTPWAPISHDTYLRLREESEYAAWVAAFGYRANHFTVAVHDLPLTNDIYSLNRFLKASGYALSAAGGEVKGDPSVLLEQSSTLAVAVPVRFADGVHEVPACYYEFAKRYVQQDGTLYGGFVETSATKLFESTTDPDAKT